MANAMTLLIDADAKGAKGEIKGLSGSVDDLGGAAEKTSKRTKILAGALTALVAGVVVVTKANIDAADAASKLSEITGETTEKITGLKLIAELSGTSVNALATGMRKLQKGMFDAATKGTGPVNDALSAMGIALTDSEGALRSTDAVIGDVADTFALMENGAAKAALAQDLMGRTGTQMIPLLNQGADAMRLLHDESVNLGIVWSEDDAQAAEDLNDAITRLKAVGDGMMQTVAMAWVPILSDLAQGAVLAAEAVLFLGKTQEELDADRREGAQDAIDAQDRRLQQLQRELDLSEANDTALMNLTTGEIRRSEETVRLTAELERQKSVMGSLVDELGAEAGILTEKVRLEREAARLRADAISAGITGGVAVEPKVAAEDDGVASLLADRARAASDLERALDSLATIMLKTEAASLSGAEAVVFQLEQERLAIEVQRDSLLANEMISAEERIAVRRAASEATVAIEDDAERQIAIIRERELFKDREAAAMRARLQFQASQDGLRSAEATIGAVGTFASEVGGLVTSLYGTQTQEGKKAARVAFGVQQALAFASATVSLFAAVGQAAASAPPPANIPAIVAATATGGVQIAGIAATTIAGIADDGLLPGALARAGFRDHATMIVRNDELVADPATTRDLGQTVRLTNQILASGGRGGSGEVSIPIVVNVDGEPVYKSTERRRTRAVERGIPSTNAIRFGA